MSIHPHTIGIVVKDMGKALAFYRLLGLAIADGQDDESHVEWSTPQGYALGFDTEASVREADIAWEEPKGQRLTFAFKCDSPADVDEIYLRVTSSGYTGLKEPWDAFWGQRYAFLQDPDHNRVDIFAELPG